MEQVFSCEFCKIFQNIIFTEKLQTTFSVGSIVEPDVHDCMTLYCYCIKLLSSITPLTCLYCSTSFTFRVIPSAITDRPKEFEQKTNSSALQLPEWKNKNKQNCKNYIDFIFEVKLVLSNRLKETIGQNSPSFRSCLYESQLIIWKRQNRHILTA